MRIVTIFDDFENVHVNKDVGLIPRYISKETDDEKSVIISRGTENYEKIIDENLKEIKIDSTSYIKYLYNLNRIIKEEKITWVNLYHISLNKFLILVFLKLMGFKIYLKTDFDYKDLPLYEKRFSKFMYRYVYKIYFRFIDLISVEDQRVFNVFAKYDFLPKVISFPNAVIDYQMKGWKDLKERDERKNEILIIGRIGSYQKNHELIIEAVKNIGGLKNWSLRFIGPVENNFEEYANDKLAGICDFSFTGVVDYKDVQKYLCSSKVFLSSSRYEGFSLAITEAAYMGCYIMTTDVGGVYDITNNYKFGCVFNNDVASLSEALTKLENGTLLKKSCYSSEVKYARARFSIKENIKDLLLELKEIH